MSGREVVELSWINLAIKQKVLVLETAVRPKRKKVSLHKRLPNHRY